MDAFLQSWHFKPLFDHYKQNVIDPEMKEPAEAGQIPAHFKLAKVQECMLRGRKENKWTEVEFSHTMNFSRLEQTAYIMHRLIMRNLKVGGVLRDRFIQFNGQCLLIWRLLKQVESDLALAEQQCKAESSQQTATQSLQPQQPETITENNPINLSDNDEYTDKEKDVESEVDPVEEPSPGSSDATADHESNEDESEQN